MTRLFVWHWQICIALHAALCTHTHGRPHWLRNRLYVHAVSSLERARVRRFGGRVVRWWEGERYPEAIK